MKKIKRVFNFLPAVVIIAIVVFGAFFSGGSSRGAAFTAGNLWIRYGIDAVGIKPERLEYMIISEEFPTSQIYDGSKKTWTYFFKDGDEVVFKVKQGGTMWIDASHKASVLEHAFKPEDVEFVEQHASRIHTSSPKDFTASVVALRAKINGVPINN